jgi:very-short-patch-repair endonuclease
LSSFSIYEAVYVTFSGPVPRMSMLWAAVLRAGPGAMLSHATAAELIGLVQPARQIHVTVPKSRRIARRDGIVVHCRAHAEARRHPSRLPPQTRIEETVLDLAEAASSLEPAVGWLTRACGGRLTTPSRMRRAMAGRKKLRWRAELTDALADVATGCHSLLERRYLRVVELAHRLPSGTRQAARRTAAGTRYDDVRYPEYRTIVELDGRAAHPDHERSRDRRRDNAATVAGDQVLRYGWAEVTDSASAVAAQVAAALQTGGWRGVVRPCGPRCTSRSTS